ncbi:MAG: Hsp33 family molecular chaperone HslO [Rickettsiales bacterium]|nr:Hsp33 family molecular chaperone HslO [Rickettsiales bacterium]
MNPTSTSPEIGLIRHEDVVQPFMLHKSSVRGRMVRLSPVMDTILSRHDHPAVVKKLLGELLTLAAMLSANLPETGILTLQAKGDGPIRFVVVDAVHGGGLRGYADLAEGSHAALEALSASEETADLAALMGSGYLAITLDVGYGEPYQGIVPLEGDSMADAVQHYFTQSQQIDVLFNLAVHSRTAKDGHKQWLAGGIMLERMPEEGGIPLEPQEGSRVFRAQPISAEESLHGWSYNALLVETATEEELLDPHLAPSALLYRLFNEAGVWVHETKTVSAHCRCSRQKIAGVLTSLGSAALQDMKEDGVIRVTCQFCNHEEIFADADITAPPV